jgi:hypothetical protein
MSFSLAPYRVVGFFRTVPFREGVWPTAILEEKSAVGVMGMVPGLPPENFASRLVCTLSGQGERLSPTRILEDY